MSERQYLSLMGGELWSEPVSDSPEAKQIDALVAKHTRNGATICIVCNFHDLAALAHRLLGERDDQTKQTWQANESLRGWRKRSASLEREVASYEGMDRAVTHYQEEVRRLERERDLLRDKWNQMETYGFDSPKAVFDRLVVLEQPCEQCRSQGRKCEH